MAPCTEPYTCYIYIYICIHGDLYLSTIYLYYIHADMAPCTPVPYTCVTYIYIYIYIYICINGALYLSTIPLSSTTIMIINIIIIIIKPARIWY